jgi:NADH-quinone oxidoreductase subunit A
MMLRQYLPILIFMGWPPSWASRYSPSAGLLGPRRPDAEKLSPYECGFEAFEDSRMRFDVRYYLVAIIFIVFDLEIAFFFPWAVSLGRTGTSACSPC